MIISLFQANSHLISLYNFSDALNEDQREILSMYIPQATKLYKELNDPLKNDKDESLDPKVMQTMKGLFNLFFFSFFNQFF